jgi:GxxExxY protein
MENNYKHQDVTSKIIKAFYNVYNELGYGFLEKVYEKALFIEIKNMGLYCVRQQSIEIHDTKHNY